MTDFLASRIQSGISGRIPDPAIVKRVIKKLTDIYWDKIELAANDAEGDRSPVQKMTRVNVSNNISLCESIKASCGSNAIIATMEGEFFFFFSYKHAFFQAA